MKTPTIQSGRYQTAFIGLTKRSPYTIKARWLRNLDGSTIGYVARLTLNNDKLCVKEKVCGPQGKWRDAIAVL